jgi:hypothetical protein
VRWRTKRGDFYCFACDGGKPQDQDFKHLCVAQRDNPSTLADRPLDVPAAPIDQLERSSMQFFNMINNNSPKGSYTFFQLRYTLENVEDEIMRSSKRTRTSYFRGQSQVIPPISSGEKK